MRRSKFFSGLFIGGILGSLFGIVFYPSLQSGTKGKIIYAHKRMGRMARMLGELWHRRLDTK